MKFRALDFDSLTPAELYQVLQARSEVFVVEQNCVYLDLDAHDQASIHLLGERGEHLAAYLRILPPGEKFEEASLGRVLTRAPWRKTGLGRLLVAEGIRACRELHSGSDIRIGAQAYLENFYSSFGFETVSAPYDEDGIPHVEMVLRVPGTFPQALR